MAQYNKNRNRLLDNNNTLYEVVMLASQLGGDASPAGNTNLGTDAFGRTRTASPLTLFDAFTRYDDNGKFWNVETGGASTSYGSDSASIDMTVPTNGNEYVWRETKRVFAYQPGKSLQVMTTFVMNEGQTNLRQRVGYFGENDGIFLEQDNGVLYFVKRSQGTNTRVAQSDWNIDPVDGTGRTGISLDVTKAQILWTDIEWLGVGSVRLGFVINGQFIHCHSFHHANSATAPYMTTACLPVRYEIENTGVTTTPSTLKQICATVISEGGYTLAGEPRSIGHTITGTGAVGKQLTTAGTYYAVGAIRLKDDRRDSIVIPTGINLVPNNASNNSVINWRVYKGASITGGSWLSAGISSSVNYNLTPTSFTGGDLITQGFLTVSNQSSQSVVLTGTDLFKYQLERNFDSSESFLIVAASNVAADDVALTMNWEEIT